MFDVYEFLSKLAKELKEVEGPLKHVFFLPSNLPHLNFLLLWEYPAVKK